MRRRRSYAAIKHKRTRRAVARLRAAAAFMTGATVALFALAVWYLN
jgi:hypothetical protein